MKFVDSCEVKVVAGTGGNGSVAFRREKFVPHGGPSGGDGGHGGSVVFVADPGLSTLLDLTYAHTLKAQDGRHGMGKDCYGKAGVDLVTRVPVGTQVVDVESGVLLFDLDRPNQTAIIAAGGRGGRGNIHFATPYDRAPRRAEPGEPGQERRLRLELKVMADVGLLGFPNVGKSTFVRAASRARPKVADYPFTTLVPHLGVVSVGDDATFVLADIPGLVPGASEGAGLGIRFLKHVERTRALLHLVTLDYAEGRSPLGDYDALMAELRTFDEALARRPMVVAMSKADLPDVREAYEAGRRRFAKRGIDLRLVSAATGEGMRDLLFELATLSRGEREAARAARDAAFEDPEETVDAEPGAKETARRAVSEPAPKRAARERKKAAAKKNATKKAKKAVTTRKSAPRKSASRKSAAPKTKTAKKAGAKKAGAKRSARAKKARA